MLVAYDGSRGTRDTIHVATELTIRYLGVLTVVIATRRSPRYGEQMAEVIDSLIRDDQARRRLRGEAVAFCTDRGVRRRVMLTPRATGCRTATRRPSRSLRRRCSAQRWPSCSHRTGPCQAARPAAHHLGCDPGPEPWREPELIVPRPLLDRRRPACCTERGDGARPETCSEPHTLMAPANEGVAGGLFMCADG